MELLGHLGIPMFSFNKHCGTVASSDYRFIRLTRTIREFQYFTSSRKLRVISFLGLSFWGVCEDITLFLRSPNDSVDRKGSEPLLCPYPYDHLRLMKIMLLLLLSDSMFLQYPTSQLKVLGH